MVKEPFDVYKYLQRVGIVISVAFNVIVLFGYSNQTTSARNWQWKRDGKFSLAGLIDFVAWILFKERDHCKKSWVYWYTRKVYLGSDSKVVNTNLVYKDY